ELAQTTPVDGSDGDHERGIEDRELRSYEVGDDDGGRNGELPLPGRPLDREPDRIEGDEADEVRQAVRHDEPDVDRRRNQKRQRSDDEARPAWQQPACE